MTSCRGSISRSENEHVVSAPPPNGFCSEMEGIVFGARRGGLSPKAVHLAFAGDDPTRFVLRRKGGFPGTRPGSALNVSASDPCADYPAVFVLTWRWRNWVDRLRLASNVKAYRRIFRSRRPYGVLCRDGRERPGLSAKVDPNREDSRFFSDASGSVAFGGECPFPVLFHATSLSRFCERGLDGLGRLS